MRRKIPTHNDLRTRYPFSFKKRYIGSYMIWFERYKLTERYDAGNHTWKYHSCAIDDRDGLVSPKEEAQTFGGPY